MQWEGIMTTALPVNHPLTFILKMKTRLYGKVCFLFKKQFLHCNDFIIMWVFQHFATWNTPHETFYKVTNLKVHSKGRYFFLNPFSRTTANGSFERQSVFLYLWHHKLYIPPTEIRLVGRLGECLIEHCTFQNQIPVRVFLYHCISDGNQLFSENVGCNFHFIL